MNRGQYSTVTDNKGKTQAAAQAVLMIRPSAFGRNEVTRRTNAFQSADADIDRRATIARAQLEFDRCVTILRRSGIEVQAFAGRTTTDLPDEVFPNNWISTHPDGTVVIYPMMAWNRRQERRRDVLEQLQRKAYGFRVSRVIDLTHLERSNRFLEGTGSLILDHGNRLAYACLSPRTHLDALREFGRATEYGIIVFDARDGAGQPIYHTNVMMSLGEGFAVACVESIRRADDRLRLLTRLERSGREVIELRREQLKSFCGNVIQLRAGDKCIILMSASARAAFDDTQLESLSRHGQIVTVNVDTIEKYGGGSIRCMLAELFLPRKRRIVGAVRVD